MVEVVAVITMPEQLVPPILEVPREVVVLVRQDLLMGVLEETVLRVMQQVGAVQVIPEVFLMEERVRVDY